MTILRKIPLVALLAFFTFFSTCNSSTETDTQAPVATSPQPSAPSTSSKPVNNSNAYTIINRHGRTVATIDMTGGQPRIDLGDWILTSRMKNGKRKYFSDNGAQMAEIKYKPGGFKLRTEAGTLRWKIKHSAEKIKVSDNEENQNPYEIKPKEAGRAKLKRNEVELGSARLREAEGKVEVEGGNEIPQVFSIATNQFSMAWPVLLINEIGVHEQMIIIAELIRAGF